MALSTTPLWRLLVQLRQRWERGDAGSGGEDFLVPETASSGVLQAMGYQGFADDVMLDFGVGAAQQGAVVFDDTLDMLDMDNMPWYAPPSAHYFVGFHSRRTKLILSQATRTNTILIFTEAI
jgi:hypothetical protein